MPPFLALFLCAGFSFFLLRIDGRIYPGATRGLWIPTVWLLTVSTKAMGTWFGSPGVSMEEGSPLDRNFLLFLGFIAILMLARRKFDLKSALRDNRLFLILLAFMFVSIVWSPVPFVSLKRWVREILAIVMGFLIMTEKDPFEAIACVVRRAVYILIPLSLVLIKYFPQYGVDYTPWTGTRMWIGVADQKNDLSQLTCLSAFFLIWSLMRNRRRPAHERVRFVALADLSVLAFALYLSKGGEAGYSATALIMLAMGLAGYVGLEVLRRKGKVVGPKIVMAVIAFIIVYAVITPLIGRLPFADISSTVGRNSTLTDRTANWAALVPVAMTKPWLGHGIGGFWTTETIGRFFFPAHNGFLEILLVLGFIGLALMSMFLISSARKAQNELAREYDWGVLWICWLAMALINNIAESSLNSFGSFLMAVPVWLTVALKERPQENAPDRSRGPEAPGADRKLSI